MKWRFEKKFDIRQLERYQVEQVVKNHPHCFSEIYHPRWINSIYFDTFDLQNYQENIMGIGHRTKYRLRWYGDVDIHIAVDKPILEKKIKNGLIGVKEKTSISDLNENHPLESILSSGVSDKIKNDLQYLKPKVLVKYYRSYFQSFDKKFILTVDTDIKFADFHNGMTGKLWSLNQSVLELKYDHDVDCPKNFGRYLPFRQSRFSKYVKGIDFLREYGL